MFSFYKFATGFWTGVMVFFTFGVGLPLFHSRMISEKMAGIVIEQIFPFYYLFNYSCGAAAVIALLVLRRNVSRFWLALALLLLAIAGIATVDFFIAPALDSLRERGMKADFQRL